MIGKALFIMGFQTLYDLKPENKTVLLRCDLNVPVRNGKITDTTRIDRLKPTIDYLVKHGAKILVLSHFGRPKGEHNPEFSLSFLPDTLSKCWNIEVSFSDDCIGEPAKTLTKKLQPGQVGLLENLRFHKGEESNDKDFARKLADLGDLHVNDAFSASHRAHASIEALAHLLPTGAGFLMQAELEALSSALNDLEHPLAIVVGGVKISTKLKLLNNLVQKADMLILGGGMANTFLYAQGMDMKKSLYEPDMAPQATAIMEEAEQSGCKIILPVDGIAAKAFEENAPWQVCDIQCVPDDHMVLDIGPQTLEMLKGMLQQCSTLVWNGPIGAFEVSPFDKGTVELAKHAAALTESHAIKSVAGGGDTVAALEHAGVTSQFSYISTAGGAFLEWMEGKQLPGVAALTAYKDSRQNAA